VTDLQLFRVAILISGIPVLELLLRQTSASTNLIAPRTTSDFYVSKNGIVSGIYELIFLLQELCPREQVMPFVGHLGVVTSFLRRLVLQANRNWNSGTLISTATTVKKEQPNGAAAFSF